jgi:beta-lactamase superfamily II metal-dependent hydrolase
MDVHVLKGNHHGSCNGISTRFLQADVAGVGHVRRERHQQLRPRARADEGSAEHVGIPWYRSDGNGRITFWTPGTPGGGYTVEVEKGTSSMDGDGDGTSSQTACSSL